MATDYRKIAQDIYDYFKEFGIEQASNCMTRLRIKISKHQGISQEKVKAIPGVLGLVVAGDEYQVILGPGIVIKVYDEFSHIIKQNIGNINEQKKATPTAVKDIAEINKAENKKNRQNNPVAIALSKFAKIFTPLLPAFIAAGILSAVAGIIQASVQNDFTDHIVAKEWYGFFLIVLTVWQTGFLMIVGYRFCELFGGKAWIGAIIGAIFTPLSGAGMLGMWHPNADYSSAGIFLGIPIGDVRINWFTSGLATFNTDGDYWTVGTPHGSIFGIILSCVASIYIEKHVSKHMHHSVDTYLTPIITTFSILVLDFILIFPISGYMFFGMSWLFQTLTTGPGAPFGDMFLAAIFIFAVLFGIHQGFIPIYVALIGQPGSGGINTLFPVLALAGTTQVGATLCLYMLAPKKSLFRKEAIGVIIPGIFGVGEPIIYGITLPRFVPLISGAIAAAVPGFVLGAINAWGGVNVGLNSVFGPSGVLATVMMTSSKGMVWGIVIWLLMIILGYISGFFSTLIGYHIFKNSKKIQWKLE